MSKNLQIPDVMKNDGLYPTTRDKNLHSPEEVQALKESLLAWVKDALADGWKLETTFWNGEDSVRLTLGSFKAHVITRPVYLGIHVFYENQQIVEVPHFYKWRDLKQQIGRCKWCGHNRIHYFQN